MRKHRYRMIALVAVPLMAIHMEAQCDEQSFAIGDLEPNSCAIWCPAHSAHSGLRGVVSCRSEFMPVCQCSNPDKKIAYCDVFREVHTGISDRSEDSSDNSIRLDNANLLAIYGPLGTAILNVENQTNCSAYYEWRFKSTARSVESGGKGDLYEQYASLNGNAVSVVSDVGGKLEMQIGPYELEWSCGSNDFGWVYKRDDSLRFSIVKSMDLNIFML